MYLVVDGFTFILSPDPRQELPLRLGNTQAVERVLDVLGHLVPRALRALGRAYEVVDVVEVDLGQGRRAPGRHRPRQEVVERLQAEVAHPLRLVLELRDLLDDLPVQALGRLVEIVLRVVEAGALRVVRVDALERALLGCLLRRRHSYSTSTLIMSPSTVTGNVSTGRYAGSESGLPVRRSNREQCRGHSTVQSDWSGSPSTSCHTAGSQRSSIA